MYDVIIIGAGPSGLTCAIYLKRFGINPLVIECDAFGGQMVKTDIIENYPGFDSISGFDLSMNMYKQAKKLNVSFAFDKIINIKKENDIFTASGNNVYTSKCVVIATGMENKKLNIENEDKYLYNGISFCAVCDGALYKGKDVCVVGGGNSAIASAKVLSKICNKVYLVHRRNTFKANEYEVNKIKDIENIIVYKESIITKLHGENTLNKITIKQNDKYFDLDISCLFECVGKKPNSANFSSLIDLTNDGYIITTDTAKTSVEGIFAIGDVTNKNVRQITTAVNDGTVCAVLVNEYLN